MTFLVGHSFITAKAQSADSTLVSKNAWNDSHSVTMSGPAVLGKSGTGNGPVTEIQASSGTGYAFRESGGTVGFGTVGTSGISDSAITASKLASGAVSSAAIQLAASNVVLGRYSAGSGGFEEIQLVSGRGGPILSGSNLLGDSMGGDVTRPLGSSTLTIAAKAVSYAKIQDITSSNVLLGRAYSTSGTIQEISLSGLEFAASALLRSAFIGDVIGNAGQSTLTISNKAVSYAKIQDITSSNVLLGRAYSTSGTIQEISLSGLAFTASALVRSAFIGDVTGLAGQSTLSISTGVVTYAKIQNLTSSNLILGRLTAGSGAIEELQIISGRGGLVLSGSNLVGDSLTGDVLRPLGSSTLTISNAVVTYAKLQNLSTSQVVLGRNTAGSGSASELSIHNQLDWLGTTIGDIIYKSSSNTWTRLAPGTSGTFLQSQSVGVAPKYVAVGGGATAAVQSDQETATDVTVYVTPGRQQYHPSAPKAWVTFNGFSPLTITASFNISSVTRTSTGDYTINFATAFSNSNYAYSIGVARDWTGAGFGYVFAPYGATPTISAFRFRGTDSAFTDQDQKYVSAVFLGDQ